jgi:hypothetical protein
MVCYLGWAFSFVLLYPALVCSGFRGRAAAAATVVGADGPGGSDKPLFELR